MNQQDLDAFIGELRSSGAHKGVVYSYSGFSEPALEKANALGISCCRLIQDRPPDIPEELVVPSFCFTPGISVRFLRANGWTGEVMSWLDLLRVTIRGDATKSVLDEVAEGFAGVEEESLVADPDVGFAPRSVSQELRLELDRRFADEVVLQVGVHWRSYRGDLKAYLINGSYSETEEEFLGQTAFPVVDLKGPDPGPGWVEVDEVPRTQSYVHAVLSGGDVRAALLEGLGPKPLPELTVVSEEPG